jgi:hypothetical protein
VDIKPIRSDGNPGSNAMMLHTPVEGQRMKCTLKDASEKCIQLWDWS